MSSVVLLSGGYKVLEVGREDGAVFLALVEELDPREDREDLELSELLDPNELLEFKEGFITGEIECGLGGADVIGACSRKVGEDPPIHLLDKFCACLQSVSDSSSHESLSSPNVLSCVVLLFASPDSKSLISNSPLLLFM